MKGTAQQSEGVGKVLVATDIDEIGKFGSETIGGKNYFWLPEIKKMIDHALEDSKNKIRLPGGQDGKIDRDWRTRDVRSRQMT